MSAELPAVPPGSGTHPIPLVVISANRLAESTTFYTTLFGWKAQPLSKELTAIMTPGGPSAALRANVPDGNSGVVPFIQVDDVTTALERIVVAGGTVERQPWEIPMVGRMARFTDPSGTSYGLTEARTQSAPTPMPMPLGPNPRPPEGSLCSLEMFAAIGAEAAAFFTGLFGWGTLATMPQYVAFDPGVGIGGVFQSHTPVTPALAYIYVNDVSAMLMAITAAGGKRMGEPMVIPGMGSFGYFKDPSGTSMGLMGR